MKNAMQLIDLQLDALYNIYQVEWKLGTFHVFCFNMRTFIKKTRQQINSEHTDKSLLFFVTAVYSKFKHICPTQII